MLTRQDLQNSISDTNQSQVLEGLSNPVHSYRDKLGIPHIQALTQWDAFLAQGYISAQDRLWQMEVDRRKGSGRWAEVIGTEGVADDCQMRKFRLQHSAKSDYLACDQITRDMLDAYALGINAFIKTGPLPIEYKITDLHPEPWKPWDSLIVFKVRHILMGVFEAKAWRGRLLSKITPDKLANMFPSYQPGQPIIMPPGHSYTGNLENCLEDLLTASSNLNYLQELDCGSNSWVISGNKTASGKPLLAGDSHRGLDTPNVYYQSHVACPEFDVIGFAIPGVPGFPHFGHNERVAWCITHLSADYQDLYIEQFKTEDNQYYKYKEEWLRAENHCEIIKVKDSKDLPLTVWVTRHGPIISGGPEQGMGISFKYTATMGARNWPDVIPKMLVSNNCEQLKDSMRLWVDPCNNLLMADVDGNIGYLARGEIPIRPKANALLPVPGWTGTYEWENNIPFDELPNSINPDPGFFATANNRPVDKQYPYYISMDFAPGYRAERIIANLKTLEKPVVEDMSKIHADHLSIPAQDYVAYLEHVTPLDDASIKAKDLLTQWNCQMDQNQIEPTIYSAWRDQILIEFLTHNLGEALTAEACNPADRGQGLFLGRIKGRIIDHMRSSDNTLLPPGQTWPTFIAAALSSAIRKLETSLGENRDLWKWSAIHKTRPKHTLSSVFPEMAEILDPPSVSMSGDADTPLAGSYPPLHFADIGGLSVARYAFDLSNWNSSLWTVPLGSSGNPGSKHYHDQTETWSQVTMTNMTYDWHRIISEAESHQILNTAVSSNI